MTIDDVLKSSEHDVTFSHCDAVRSFSTTFSASSFARTSRARWSMRRRTSARARAPSASSNAVSSQDSIHRRSSSTFSTSMACSTTSLCCCSALRTRPPFQKGPQGWRSWHQPQASTVRIWGPRRSKRMGAKCEPRGAPTPSPPGTDPLSPLQDDPRGAQPWDPDRQFSKPAKRSAGTCAPPAKTCDVW